VEEEGGVLDNLYVLVMFDLLPTGGLFYMWMLHFKAVFT